MQGPAEPDQPFASTGMVRDANEDVARRAVLDERAIRVVFLPGAGLAEDPDPWNALERLHEVVVNARVRQDLLHQGVEPRIQESTVGEQVVEAGNLEGGG